MEKEHRQALAAEIDKLTARAQEIRDAAIAPFREEINALESRAEELREQLGDDAIGQCEGCDCYLFEGDKGYRYAEGELACEGCAPTWADIEKMLNENPGAFDDPAEARTAVEVRKAAGTLDEKNVFVL